MVAMAVAASPPCRAEVLALFRSLLRTARKFTDYNMREYTKRRTIDAFLENRNVSEPSALASAYSDGQSQLQVAQRQATIYSLFQPNLKSVMDSHNP